MACKCVYCSRISHAFVYSRHVPTCSCLPPEMNQWQLVPGCFVDVLISCLFSKLRVDWHVVYAYLCFPRSSYKRSHTRKAHFCSLARRIMRCFVCIFLVPIVHVAAYKYVKHCFTERNIKKWPGYKSVGNVRQFSIQKIAPSPCFDCLPSLYYCKLLGVVTIMYAEHIPRTRQIMHNTTVSPWDSINKYLSCFKQLFRRATPLVPPVVY